MPRAIAQFCHDVSFANLNQKEVSSVTIISRGGARRPPREAATVSSAPQGRWLGKCATGVADGLPLDDVAPAVEGSGRETQCREAASREDALCAFLEQLLDFRCFAQGACCPHRCLRNVLLDPSGGSSQLISSIISSVAKGLPALGELPALQTGTISGPPSTISNIISNVTRGLPALGELDPCADELGLAILEISTITMTHLTEWMTHNPRIKMLLSPGAAVILAGPRRLSFVDSTARMDAPRPSLSG